MASWTIPTLHTTGEDLSVTDYNGVANNTTFLYQAPYGLYYPTGTTNCPSGGGTAIPLGSAVASGYGMALSAGEVVTPLAGIYQVSFCVTFNGGGGTQWVQSAVQCNNGQQIDGSAITANNAAPGVSGAGLFSCNAGVLLELIVTNQTGVTLTAYAGPAATFLHIIFMGSQ